MSSSSSDPAAALGEAWRSPARTHSTSPTTPLSTRFSPTASAYGQNPSEPAATGGISEYYPNGYKYSKTGRPAVMLNLMENRFLGRVADATATYDVSILDVNGNLVQRHADPGTPQLYSLQKGKSGGHSGIWADIMEDATTPEEQTPEEQKKALRLLKEDSLVVRCDVTVQSLEESRAKWLLRRFLQ